ncbi:transglutaminase family protein [Jannaschia rubra]|uniref:Transglutaminase-like superfamily protein n=1 Tax=Jannaschia rubra TaxID=282197 RepID=A0A0M6XS55_9RHOB|nr:transglutaminase family protein [Jannaschia rubra]CTQ33628.1 Transglutaminase-like superfamily protein [Jannaschia rubra]SFG05214.1 Transglutaminase-like enzyme, putative cysteine protease [Jannaschia rubra]
MTARLSIRHTTTYRWSEPVTYALQQLRLTPKSRAGQTVLDWTTEVEGGRVEATFDDAHANQTQLVSVDAGQREVTITARGTVEVEARNGVVGAQKGFMPLWMFLRPTDLTRRGPGTMALAREVRDVADPLERMHALSAAIRDRVAFDTTAAEVTRTAEDAVAAGAGVCQDHAHIFLTCARLLEVPARYVSGYLKMDDRDEQDATHAWAEAHLEGLGWTGFDVSNVIAPDDRYVRVATGSDYSDAAPVTGVRQGAGEETLDVHLSVRQAQQ